MDIQRDQTFTVPEEVLFQEVSGEIVLLDLASEKYFGLDEIGARIWQLLHSGSSVGEVLDQLQEEYDVAPETLASDVSELLENLSEAGLIKV